MWMTTRIRICLTGKAVKTDIHRNSLEAYDSIQEKKAGAREQVFTAIFLLSGRATRQDIAERLGWEINRVTGRVRELIDAGKVIECGTVKAGGRSRALLKVKPLKQEQIPLI